MPADRRRLTKLGRRLARLPVDPRLGRMVLAAERARLRARGDGRRRGAVDPGPARAPGRQAPGRRRGPRPLRHATAPTSWRSCGCGTTCASSSGRCRPARSAGCAAASSSTSCGCASGRTCSASCARPPARWAIHPSTTAAHPGQDPPGVAVRAAVADRAARRRGARVPRGPRCARFLIGRESAAAKKLPRWVMAGGLVETNRLWARTVAPIQPEWAERAGAHLVEPLVRRAGVGSAARRGGDDRTGDAVRAPARQPPRRLRPRRPSRGAGAVHPPCARCTGSGPPITPSSTPTAR